MTTTYQPGVCNIGPAEIRRRRVGGWAGVVVAVLFLVATFALSWPAPVRLLVFIPAAMAANGFLQAGFHFCVNFATRGLFNFGDQVGKTEAVHEAEYRRADQRKAIQIILLSVLIAAVVAVATLLVPLP